MGPYKTTGEEVIAPEVRESAPRREAGFPPEQARPHPCLTRTTRAPSPPPQNRKHSTADSPLTRVKVVRKIDRATKESFAQDIFADAEVEGFIKASGQSMYPKLMRRARAKAMSLGLEWKDDYADGMCAERKQRPMPVKEPEPAEEEAEAGGEEAAAEE